MKMKSVIGHFSAVVVLIASAGARAQELPGLDKSNKVFSVLYSSSSAKALIGVINDKNVAAFAECDAPRGGSNATMALDALSRCEIIEGSQFFYTQEIATRVNDLFPGLLQANYRAEIRKDLQDRSMMPYVLVASVGIGGAYFAGTSAAKAFRQKQPFMGMTMGAVGLLSSGIGILGLIASYSAMTVSDSRIPSLESDLVNKYQGLVTRKAERSDLKLTETGFIFTYELIRKTILMSIENASMA